MRWSPGGVVDVATLILLGGAGGLLRGVLDAYAQFLNWQTDRRTHRQTGQESETPRFQEYFDSGVESVAALLHSGMGAGAAVLLGATGQINGAYAAIVVGISAPVLLTQLSRIQSVSDALSGGQPSPPATIEPTPPPAAMAQTPPAPPIPPGGSLPPAHTENTAGRAQPGSASGPAANGQPVTNDEGSATTRSCSTIGCPKAEGSTLGSGQFATEGEST